MCLKLLDVKSTSLLGLHFQTTESATRPCSLRLLLVATQDLPKRSGVFKCQGCDVIPATWPVLFSLQLHNWEKQKPPWQCFTLTCQASHSPSDRELPQGQAQGSLPAMGDICLPASLTCSGPVGRESGQENFPQWSLESFFYKLWNYSRAFFSCIFLITFLANFVSNYLHGSFF